MSKVFFSISMSLDGYMAPESRFDDVGDNRWLGQWMKLQEYVLEQKVFREKLKFGGGGLEGEDNDILTRTFDRTGVTIMGKRMFDGGERSWPEEAPFHHPVIVLTRAKREPWVRPGGTTFHFENEGIGAALKKARELAKGKDIRIGGGAKTIRAYLQAGLVDEFHIALAPVFFGGGESLFDRLDLSATELKLERSVNSPKVTHLFYSVRR
ncbi:MAG: dihydrofolate reductase family protein [Archangium sp.]